MAKKKKATKKNAPKMKRLPKSSGWMPAKAVKFVRRGGKTVVLVRKAKRTRRK